MTLMIETAFSYFGTLSLHMYLAFDSNVSTVGLQKLSYILFQVNLVFQISGGLKTD